MNFLLVTGSAGILFIFTPLYLARHFSSKFKLPGKIFLKAGFISLAVSFFHFAVVENIVSIWPQISSLILPVKALFFGFLGALFFELGRFVILDKIMKTIRSCKEAIFFSFGWTGSETLFFGLIMFLGVFAIHMLVSQPDIAGLFPNLPVQELEQMKKLKFTAEELIKSPFWFAFSPLFQQASQIVVDVFLTLLVVWGLKQEKMIYIWGAIAFKSFFMASFIYLNNLTMLTKETIFLFQIFNAVFFTSCALILLHFLKKRFQYYPF